MQVRQGQAKGLGHAVLCAKPLVGDAPFAVVLPDVLIDDALFNAELGLRQGGTGRTDVEHSFCRRPYILNCVEP